MSRSRLQADLPGGSLSVILAARRAALHTALALLLITATVAAAFAPIARGQFLDHDDPDYVAANPQVQRGLDLVAVRWAFTTFHAGNWHPLTWLSHELDVTLFGMNPARHHLMSVALHAITAGLLFIVLRNLTGKVWRSVAVALLFAVHPLRVESVAWVAERKDVLCGLFWMLTLLVYLSWVRRRAATRYALLAGTMSLALLAKPMAVTLPCVLLLLDGWPLGRFRHEPWSRLAAEKTPLFLLAGAAAAVTVAAQSSWAAIRPFVQHPFPGRVANAVVSGAMYLRETVWPSGLIPFHRYPASLPVWQPALAVLILAILCAGVWLTRRRGYPATGWCWYLGTLVPVIGLVQVGNQSRADRYTYLPLIGIFLLAVWGSCDLALRTRVRAVLVAGWAAVILILAVSTNRQTVFWQRRHTLFTRVLQYDPENWLALYQVGIELGRMGRTAESTAYMEAAFARAPFLHADMHFRSAQTFLGQGSPAQALAQLEEVRRIDPQHKLAGDLRDQIARSFPGLQPATLGFQHPDRTGAPSAKSIGDLIADGNLEGASARLRHAIELNPESAESYDTLGSVLMLMGRRREAIEVYLAAVRLKPDLAQAHYNLGLALAEEGRQGDAVDHYRKAVAIAPCQAKALNNLGNILDDLGMKEEAGLRYGDAIRCQPDYPEAYYNLGVLLVAQGRTSEAVENLSKALHYKPDFQAAQSLLEKIRTTPGK